MAANQKQASSLILFLIGFTLVPAGLATRASHPGMGLVVMLIGLGILILAFAGAHRIKRLEFTDQS